MFNAITTVTHDTDLLQELTDAYHAVLVALDEHQHTMGVVDYVQARVEADRIAFTVRDYKSAIAALNALAGSIER